MRVITKRIWLCNAAPLGLIALIVLFNGLSALLLTNGQEWGDDFAIYIMQAESIARGNPGEFLARNTFMVENSTGDVGPPAAPWGYPVLLAPLYALFGADLLPFKLLNLVCYSLFLLTLFFLVRPRLDLASSLLTVAVFASNLPLLIAQDQVLSDIPFLFVSTLALLLIDRWVVQSTARAMPQGVLLGLVIFCAFWIRSNGLVLLPALLVAQLARLTGKPPRAWLDRQSLLSMVAPYLVLLALLIPTQLLLPQGGTGHLPVLFQASFKTVSEHLELYSLLLAKFFTNGALAPLVLGVTVPFLLLGIAARVRADYHLIVYGVLTLLLYVTWPPAPDLRYIFPVLPIYMYLAFQGMRRAVELMRSPPPWAMRLTYGFWVLVIASSLYFALPLGARNLEQHRETPGPYERASDRLFLFINNRTRPQDVIVFFKPRLMRMLTGRDSLLIDQCAGLERADYVVLYKKAPPHIHLRAQTLANCPPPLTSETVFENARFIVYRVRSP